MILLNYLLIQYMNVRNLPKVKKIDVINKIISYNAYNLDIINSWVQIQGLFASIIEEIN